MWIFTKSGFYSVVQHDKKPTMYMVRSRIKADLEAIPGVKDIVDDGGADYRWRVPVSKRTFKKFMADALTEIDYSTGVKDNIDQKNSARHTALYGVWTAMMKLQDGGRYSDWGCPPEYDPADFVAVEPGDQPETWDVVVLTSHVPDPTATVINTFSNLTNAELLAQDVRDTLGTWPGFIDSGDHDLNPPESSSTTMTEYYRRLELGEEDEYFGHGSDLTPPVSRKDVEWADYLTPEQEAEWWERQG